MIERLSSEGFADRAALLVKVARLYHEQGVRQPDIADRLHMSQSRVSRLLKEAVDVGIVRTVVVPPPGSHADLEDAVRARFDLVDVVVADAEGADDAGLVRALGVAAAAYLGATLTGGERIGVSSWSATLLATVAAMSGRSAARSPAAAVVQLQGGVGALHVQAQATRLVEGLAAVTGATATVFPVPGIVGSRAARDALLEDEHARELVAAWSGLDTALVGIGSLQPSELLRTSGNAISEAEQSRLREAGAVGDVCLRFFDADGAPVVTDLDDRVLAIPRDVYRAVPRRIGVAGGARKASAIRAAASGRWVDVLITDAPTARLLLQDP
jgi:DNA-binding transcriptional regulator LsrR (DeoR family)